MKENDIAVELSALSTGSRNISRRVGELQRLASVMKHNLAVAGRDFTSVNFAYAEKAVDEMLRAMSIAQDQMDGVRKFLSALGDRAEQYLGCRFKG